MDDCEDDSTATMDNLLDTFAADYGYLGDKKAIRARTTIANIANIRARNAAVCLPHPFYRVESSPQAQTDHLWTPEL